MEQNKKREERFEMAYSIYLAIKEVVNDFENNSSGTSYIARALGQLIYNKFGKVVIGISE